MADATLTEEERRRKINEIAAAVAEGTYRPEGPATASEFTAPSTVQLEPRPPVDVETARQEARSALIDRQEQLDGIGPGVVGEAVAGAPTNPDPIRRDIGLGALAARALLPQQIQNDERPLSQAGLLAEAVKRTAAAPLSYVDRVYSPLVAAAQFVQKQTNQLDDSGLNRGVRRAVDAFVPDSSIAESVTGYDSAAPSARAGLAAAGEAMLENQDPARESALGFLFDSPVQRVAKLARAAGFESAPLDVADEASLLWAVGNAAQVPQQVDPRGTGVGMPKRLQDVVFDEQDRPQSEVGRKAESDVMWFLRLASAPEALVLETMERAPMLVPQAAAVKARDTARELAKDERLPGVVRSAIEATVAPLALVPDPGPTTLFESLLDPLTIGDVVGASPGFSTRSLQPDEAPPVAALRGVLERIERGAGAEEEGAHIATRVAGPEYADAGWWLGMGVSALGFPESGLFSLGRRATNVTRATRALGRVSDASLFERLAMAADGTAIRGGEVVGQQAAHAFETGAIKEGDLPQEVMDHVRQVAAKEYGVTWDEALVQSGLKDPSEVKVDLNQKAREAAEFPKEEKGTKYGDLMQPAPGWNVVGEAPVDVKPRPIPLDPKEGAPGTQYVIRNAWGDIVPGGVHATLGDAVDFVMNRRPPTDGDVLWRSGDRPIGRWAPTWDRPPEDVPGLGKRLADEEAGVNAARAEGRKPLEKEAAQAARVKELEDRAAGLKVAADEAEKKARAAYREMFQALTEQQAADAAALAASKAATGPQLKAALDRVTAVAREGKKGKRGVAQVVKDARAAEVKRLVEARDTAADVAKKAADRVDRARTRHRFAKKAVPSARAAAERQAEVAATARARLDVLREEADAARAVKADRKATAAELRESAATIEGVPSGGHRFIPTAGARGADLAILEADLRKAPPRKLMNITGQGTVFGRAIMQAQSGLVAAEPTTLAGQVVRDAFRLWARNNTSSDLLVYLPTGAMVSPHDRRAIMGRVERDLREAGLSWTDEGDLKFVQGGELSESQAAALAALQQRVGLLPEKQGREEMLRKLTNKLVRYHGGVLADVAHKISGVPGFAQSLQDALGMLHTDRREWTGALKVLRDTPYATSLVKAFAADAMAALPAPTREVMTRLRSRLERIPDDTLSTLRESVSRYRQDNKVGMFAPLSQSEMADVLVDHFREWQPVGKVEATQADRIQTVLDAGDEAAMVALRNDLAPVLPAWARDTDSPELIATALTQHNDKIRQQMRDAGRDYAEGLYASADLGGRGIADQIKVQESLEALYREVFLDGVRNGPAFKAITQNLGKREASQTHAMLAFIVAQRRRQVLAEEFSELLDVGAIVSKDEEFVRSAQRLDDKFHALTTIATGSGYRIDERGRRVYAMPEGLVTWAEDRLQAMGIEPGAGEQLIEVKVGKDQRAFLVPKHIEQTMIQLLSAGKVTSLDEAITKGMTSDTAGRKLIGETYRLWKEGMTVGFVAPRPTYILGQILGQVQLLALTRGPAEALATTPTLFKSILPGINRYGLVGELQKRLSDPPRLFESAPTDRMLRTATGQLVSINELERLARDYGLGDSIVSFEAGQQLQSILTQETTRIGRLAFLPSEWQRMLRETAGAVDQSARLSVFVAEIKKGTPAAEAARVAKAAALDFRNITPFEAAYMRWWVTFYAYLRKSSDAVVSVALRHPERVLQQMKVAHASHIAGRTETQLGAEEGGEAGRLRVAPAGNGWGSDIATPDGRLNNRYTYSLQTPAVGVSEMFENLAVFAAPFAVVTGNASATDRLLGGVSPFIDLTSIAVTGQRAQNAYRSFLRGGAEPTDTELTVPEWMMSSPLGPAIRDYFMVEPVMLREQDDPLLAQPSAGNLLGTTGVRGARWQVGSSTAALKNPGERALAVRSWAMFMLAIGATTTNFENYSRAVGATKPRPDLTQWDERAYLFGLRPGRELTPAEAGYQQDRAREREAKAIAADADALTDR